MVEGFDYEDTSPHVTHEVLHGDTPMDVNSPYPPETLADAKAKEAKASVAPLTPVEKFVAMATHTNYKLFRDALNKACDEIEGVFNADWIPEGDPHFLMHRFDNAKNFLVLADTYFRALSTPVMQACSVHLTMQSMAPAEPSAEERQLSGPDLEGRRITAIYPCSHAGMTGLITGYDPDDGDYLIKFANGDVEYHERSCFQLEK